MSYGGDPVYEKGRPVMGRPRVDRICSRLAGQLPRRACSIPEILPAQYPHEHKDIGSSHYDMIGDEGIGKIPEHRRTYHHWQHASALQGPPDTRYEG